MIKKNIDNAEIPAGLMDTLRCDYAGDREKKVEDCPVSGETIAYAFEELAQEERQEVEAHLESCRACMNLVLDARAAETESRERGSRPTGVLPALSAAINGPARPSLIEKLATAFKIPSMAPKIIATAAIAFIAVPIAYYALKEPAAVNKLPVTGKKIDLPRIEETKQADPPVINSQEETSSLNSIITRRGWSIDPFEPLFNGKSGRVALKKKRAKRVPRTPLETLDLSQVKLVGVMLSDKGNTALVEDATGKGYTIKEGTYIGMNAGRVVQILKDRFIVEEKIEDVHGKIIPQKTVIKLNKP